MSSTKMGANSLPSVSLEEFPPAPNSAVFRDLLVFEERLKQNAARLKSRKNKYQIFLAILCVMILVLLYYVLYQTSQHWLLYYVRIGLLMVCCTMLFLFFASGIYADRITAAKNFVPQANRALGTFNMYLNMRTATTPSGWVMPFQFWRSVGVSNNTVTPDTVPPATSDKSFVRRSGRRIFRRRNLVDSIPPTRNERGEIMFSSRVSANFREGYERYRNAFERKRREKLQTQQYSSYLSLYLSPFRTRSSPAALDEKTDRNSRQHPKGS
ncbi:hypothetical protein MPSI1_003723 [Malassezia psittaci]|uniref:Transmembrane protein 188 n=1 Tax=Malassezia psittaci TaxID=1821823 RepID=A0AAF0JME4_9BASI|nr:hypothetical protein MPSI1_003723 [Malassezia psittaci]